MAISQQLRVIASWRLAAELVRRYPHMLRIIETHPGGGQYDCLDLVEHQPPRPVITHLSLNRHGSAHGEHGTYAEVWEHAVSTDDPRGLLDRLAALTNLPPVSHVPPSTPAVVVYRLIAAALAQAAFGRVKSECRSGYLDSSGMDGSGVREAWFAHFPEARHRLAASDANDVLGVPAYRFWFLLRDGEPQACLGSTGLAWDRTGRQLDLWGAYALSRNLWDAVGALLRGFGWSPGSEHARPSRSRRDPMRWKESPGSYAEAGALAGR